MMTDPARKNGHALYDEQPLLVAEHISKVFPLRRTTLVGARPVARIVEDVSLALYPSQALALVGESGSGKTTVARLLAHMFPPSSGSIRLTNVPSTRGESAYRHAVQMIFQDPFASLNPVHTVRYHLSRPLRINHIVQSQHAEAAAIRELLERVNLTPAAQFIDKYPHQLSGGQRQRIAIAQALAARPQVILADEPVSMLDVSIRLDILNLLLRLKDEEHLAFLFITHDIASARYVARDTLVMYAGQMVEGGPSESVIRAAKHPYTQLLISAAPDPDRAASAAPLAARGEPPSVVNPPTGCRFHLRCPHVMPVCKERFPGRTVFENGHWTHCFLYGDGEASAPLTRADAASNGRTPS